VELLQKLEILADAAKYDASCASSSTDKRNSKGKTDGIGSTEGIGICHAYAPDGRCISLLKILLTNFCIYECAYCINRSSSAVKRARFTVDEVVRLTLGFYRRNCIEGLFLSSGIIRNPDYTMEQVVGVARTLRVEHGFRGYIHLKTIPDAAPELLAEAGRWADRLSINVELPTDGALADYAPEKDAVGIRKSMGRIRLQIDEAGDRKSHAGRKPPRFAPAGQSTQMIVGADASSDATILGTSTRLYASYGLRRVYYSAFSPIPDASSALPPRAAPLVREHRLYQADWLLRFYGFTHGELPVGTDGNLPLDIDPKLAWAMGHREHFPVDVNTGTREALLRVPGIGAKSVDRLIAARRHRRLGLDDLARLRLSVRKVAPFVTAAGHNPGREAETRRLLAEVQRGPAPKQLALL
jgi:putative DNA modification/repair radical SAM protein